MQLLDIGFSMYFLQYYLLTVISSIVHCLGLITWAFLFYADTNVHTYYLHVHTGSSIWIWVISRSYGVFDFGMSQFSPSNEGKTAWITKYQLCTISLLKWLQSILNTLYFLVQVLLQIHNVTHQSPLHIYNICNVRRRRRSNIYKEGVFTLLFLPLSFRYWHNRCCCCCVGFPVLFIEMIKTARYSINWLFYERLRSSVNHKYKF